MLDIQTGATAPPLPLQFVSVEITPLSGGQFSVLMHATLLDEEELQFIAEDLVNERVDTLDQALTVIRRNVAALAPPCAG
jgi:hypothetical protein